MILYVPEHRAISFTNVQRKERVLLTRYQKKINNRKFYCMGTGF